VQEESHLLLLPRRRQRRGEASATSSMSIRTARTSSDVPELDRMTLESAASRIIKIPARKP
jgi:hypothetical protein